MADTYWDHPARRETKRLLDLDDVGAILDELQNQTTEWDDAREALDHLVRGPRAEVERLRAERDEATGTAFRCANCGLWHHDDEPAEQDVRCDECGHAQPRDDAEFQPAYTAVKAERDAFRLEAADAAAKRDAAEARVEELEDGWDRLAEQVKRAQDPDLIRRAIADPGAYVKRKLDNGEPAETVPAWGARAVIAALDGTEAGR